jgi:hypothetical protein
LIRLAISQAAFDAIAKTPPLGTVAFEAKVTAEGERALYFDDREADRLSTMLREGESYSDVIVRLAESRGIGGLRAVAPVVAAARS